MNRTMSWAAQLILRTKLTCFKSKPTHFSTNQLDLETEPLSDDKIPQDQVVLDNSTIELLQRLALVNFGSEKSKEILEDAIKFADKIHTVNTDNVKPLVNVLDNEHSTPLRDDVVHMENMMQDVMLNAKHVEEDYFVAPPSNVPLYQGADEKK